MKNESYWDQSEAKLLFGQIGLDEENVYETIEKRIERLSQAAHSPMGWKTVLDDFDSQDLCTTYEIFNIRLKSQFVATALMHALTHMPSGRKWDDCIKFSIDSLKEVGFEKRNPETVRIWHREFRLNKECFLNPAILRKYRKAPLPPLLEQNPELRERLINYCKEKLSDLSSELLLCHLHDTLLPQFLKEIRAERNEPALSMYLFLFDHSSGHDKQRPDGLCASRMTKGFGGAQPKMRPSVIVSADYLGPYDHPMKLIVGSEQLMVFRDSDRGPFWMSDAEREKRKCDKALGSKNKKKLTVAELKKMLADKGLAANGLMSDLQERAKNFNLPVEKEVDQIEEGWVGKPKGMLQVLWERGFIDPAKGWNDYTLNGKSDNFGNIICATSVKSLTQSLLDFLEEETLLQYHGRLIGVLVDRTPICHPELAGEGIEYCWACSKGFYRWRLPLKSKKGKENFKKSVRQALSQKNLKTGTVRLLSAKARSYMLAYLSIDECPGAKDTKTSHQMIEKLVKKWKTHRNVSDLETGFIAGILKSMVKQSNHDN